MCVCGHDYYLVQPHTLVLMQDQTLIYREL